MAKPNEAFVVELADLYWAGANQFPLIAAHYAQATRHLHNSSWKEDEAFNRWEDRLVPTTDKDEMTDKTDTRTTQVPDKLTKPFKPGWDVDRDAPTGVKWESFATKSRVYPHLQALRDRLQEILGETSWNLQLTGTALVQVAESYAAQDDANAEALRQTVAGFHDDPVRVKAPVDMPVIKMPGAEYDTHVEVKESRLPFGMGDKETEVLDEEPKP
ncbi:hypothetical protein [Stackebrandtia soli]|uniref:hypothetical protein n=1 Tax=Stackebrandtia soli TaxID=1892856 RepID=UPI0039E93A1F